MSLALPNKCGEVVHVRAGQYKELLEASRQSPRLRMIEPIQRCDSNAVQRLLNALQPGTYVRPHRHPLPHATETVVLLQGALGIVIYDDEGNVKQTIQMSAGDLVDIEPKQWHSMVCLAPDTVIAEFKKGPYDAPTDKEFAAWSAEGDDDGFVKGLQALFSAALNT